MAGNIPPHMVDPTQAPQHIVSPSPREMRSHAVHRLQVGLFGLCAMLLLVGLANIIMDRARLADVEEPVNDVIAADNVPKKQATDPLADIGVVPSADPTPTASVGVPAKQ